MVELANHAPEELDEGSEELSPTELATEITDNSSGSTLCRYRVVNVHSQPNTRPQLVRLPPTSTAKKRHRAPATTATETPTPPPTALPVSVRVKQRLHLEAQELKKLPSQRPLFYGPSQWLVPPRPSPLYCPPPSPRTDTSNLAGQSTRKGGLATPTTKTLRKGDSMILRWLRGVVPVQVDEKQEDETREKNTSRKHRVPQRATLRRTYGNRQSLLLCLIIAAALALSFVVLVLFFPTQWSNRSRGINQRLLPVSLCVWQDETTTMPFSRREQSWSFGTDTSRIKGTVRERIFLLSQERRTLLLESGNGLLTGFNMTAMDGQGCWRFLPNTEQEKGEGWWEVTGGIFKLKLWFVVL
ncbi:hypothetical protein BT69DRAFT_1282060 [Atractiella rhizophila]|nr:hypothetical protein BT69DRAFT_1282060 [Atractiella rhizophila]